MNIEEVKEILNKDDCPPLLKAIYSAGVNQGFKEGYSDGKEDSLPELSESEEAYRKGFSHGWHVGKTNPTITYEAIKTWRYSRKKVGAPGTPFANKPV